MRTWFALLLLFTIAPLGAHELITTKLTYAREISRLIERRCIGCHGPSASVALASYEQARPWAKAIRDQVLTRQMPPWGAVPGFGPELRNDPSLTAAEIDMVVRWVEGGAPNGDEALLPRHVSRPAENRPAPKPPLFAISCDWKVPTALLLTGVRPEELGPKDQLRLTLMNPDGAVRPVIWIRNDPSSGAGFVLAQPLSLPAGSTLHLEAHAGARAALSLSRGAPLLPLSETEIRKQKQNCPAP